MIKTHGSDERGFTIIELMISTAILSTILVLVSILLINIGNLYYKGVNQSRIQDNVRGVSDEITQHIQLGDTVSASKPSQAGPNGEQAYCIGTLRYTYVAGIQIGSPLKHALWRDNNPSPGACSVQGSPATAVNLAVDQASDPSLNGTELIAPHSRLTILSVIGSTGYDPASGTVGNSPYSLAIGEAYGDNDLLCNRGVSTSCDTTAAMVGTVNYTDYPDSSHDVLCRGNTDQQFCATAKLNTSVVRRLP